MPAVKRKSENGKQSSGSKKKGKQAEVEDEIKVEELNIEEGKSDESQPDVGLLMSGCAVFEAIGRSKGGIETNKLCLFTPHRLSGLTGIKITKVISSCSAAHAIFISSDFDAYVIGRNENGQLGIGTEGKGNDVVLPTKLESKLFDNSKISDAACGKGHTLFLSTEGRVFACGDNTSGQLGITLSQEFVTKPKKLNFEPYVKMMACGQLFSMIVDTSGNLYSFGHPEYGQLGHGTDGRMIGTQKYLFSFVSSPTMIEKFVMKGENVKETREVEDVKVKYIACGYNHTIVVDTENRIFTWGCGGYGRLGHNITSDEMTPRQNTSFLHFKTCEITNAAAGSTFSLVSMGHKMLYICGQTRMSSNGADMYFKPVMEISGWQITSMSCANKGIVAVGEGQAISWGPSPTMGELALGAGDPNAAVS